MYISAYGVYSMSIASILMWISKVWYALKRRRFSIRYLCMLFMGDGVKRGHQRTFR
jgi:hypothetical protein